MQSSRRTFLKSLAALPLADLVPGHALAAVQGTSRIGSWSVEHDLPVYTYEGPLTFPRGEGLPGDDALPDDPYFLLGNYRLTLFTHASGHFQILTGERAWGRINQGPKPWTGANSASLQVEEQQIPLIGPECEAARTAAKRFGIGFAQYTYRPVTEVQVTRTLSVAPSRVVGTGQSAFLLSVRLRNLGRRARRVRYCEEVRANYAQIFAAFDARRTQVQYKPQIVRAKHIALCSFAPRAAQGKFLLAADEATPFELEPPALFLAPRKEADGEAVVVQAPSGEHSLQWQMSLTLDPGEERFIECVIGYTREGLDGAERTIAALTPESGDEAPPYFRNAWQQQLPPLREETDVDLRREMRWHAGMLEAMATWKEDYDERLFPRA